jgi:predicted PurR-regulated permease PerM
MIGPKDVSVQNGAWDGGNEERDTGRDTGRDMGRDTVQGTSVVSMTTLAAIVVVCWIFFVAKEVFLPLALGMLIAFILSPAVAALRRRGLGDGMAVALTVCLAGGVLLAFCTILALQLTSIGENLPKYQGNVLSKIDGLLQAGEGNQMFSHLSGMFELISQRIGAATASAEGVAQVEVVEKTSVTDWISGVILPALSPFAVAGIVVVLVVFALVERTDLRDRLVQLIGGTDILATSRMLAEAGQRVSSYLVMQLVVNVIYALPIWLGLWAIGVPNAAFFGLVTLIMRFVPYIGSITSACLPLLMAFAVSPDWSMFLWTAALFGVVEFVTSNAIEPWLYGQRTGVSPMAVIVSALFWTWLWGPIGLIMATPLTVCLVVIGNHVPALRLFPILFGDAPTLDEKARLYDRLLAGHSGSFQPLSNKTSQRVFLADHCDRIALPALAMAQADMKAGLLSEAQVNRIAQTARDWSADLESLVEDELAGAVPEVEGAGLVTNGVPDGLGMRIAVIGANTRFDDVAAQILAQALRTEGTATIALPHRGSMMEALGSFAPDAVVFASLDPSHGPGVERRIAQLRRRWPQLRLGVAAWPGRQAEADMGPSVADFTTQGMEDTFRHLFAPNGAMG